MNMLLEYVRNIGYFLILMSLVSNVMPDNSYKKYCRMFCGLILMVLVINPFYDFMNLEGDLAGAFADANYRSQVAELENQLINNDNSMNERIIREYEQLIIDELQGIANEEGLYILDVKVDVEEVWQEEGVKLSRLNVFVTTDIDRYQAELDNNKEQGRIYVDKINIGEPDNIGSINNSENINPMFISFINRAGEFLKIDTSIINVEEDKRT